MGDIVEYPLREQEQEEGRDKGVGLLVGRNLDRGDASTLPPETLDLCEIEPLRQEEEGSSRHVTWTRQMTTSCHCHLTCMMSSVHLGAMRPAER